MLGTDTWMPLSVLAGVMWSEGSARQCESRGFQERRFLLLLNCTPLAIEKDTVPSWVRKGIERSLANRQDVADTTAFISLMMWRWALISVWRILEWTVVSNGILTIGIMNYFSLFISISTELVWWKFSGLVSYALWVSPPLVIASTYNV